jgi:predicted amidohydrolase
MSERPGRLRLAVAQTAPVLRAVERNVEALAALGREAAADLLLTAELSLTGYDLRDAVHVLARPVERGEMPAGTAPLRAVPGQVVAGLVEDAPGGPYNTAAVLEGGKVVFRHRKVYLPTYGMFDEARWFGRGSALAVWRPRPGWRAGVLICEDFWHPGLVYVLAARGIDLLLVQAAAPGRGVVEGGDHGAFASADVWERIARTTAQVFGVYVALANRVGIEGGVSFAGGSLVAAPDGTVLARAGDDAPEVLSVVLERDALDTARRPYAHARDDDPRLVLRELGRALDA